MVGPARKREAVGHLQRELELSQRRACKVVGQSRAGYRAACGQLRQEGLRRQSKAGAETVAGRRAESAAQTVQEAASGHEREWQPTSRGGSAQRSVELRFCERPDERGSAVEVSVCGR